MGVVRPRPQTGASSLASHAALAAASLRPQAGVSSLASHAAFAAASAVTAAVVSTGAALYENEASLTGSE